MKKLVAVGLGVAGMIAVGLAVYKFVGVPDVAVRESAHLSATELSDQGLKAYYAHDLEAAIASYTLSLKRDPNNSLTYLRRGTALQEQGQFEAASADYTQAIKLNTFGTETEAALRSMRGHTFARLGKAKEALEDYDQSIALNPVLPKSYRERATLKLVTGGIGDAKPDYEAVLKIVPNDRTAQLGLGIVHYWERDWAKAAAYFALIREKSKQDAEIAMWSVLARLRNNESVKETEYQDIDQNKWPGQIIAHLLGHEISLDKYIEDAAAKNDPQIADYICRGSFAAFALIQIKQKVEKTAEEYAKISNGGSYLDSVSGLMEKCGVASIERVIVQNEIKYLKAQHP
ncbi:MAG: tetratricopeptide repeat protein [Rhodospirillaceae bacterium]|nr:tetratricopeptide repeat protein [Rhodospirillaceae bacterium]